MFYVIPAIDLLDNNVVRLYKGNYDEKKIYYQDPTDIVKYFKDIGVKRVHIVDLNAARDGNTKINRKSIDKIIKEKDHLILEIGGGIRNHSIIKEYIERGIDYLILGTIAVKNPDLVENILTQFPKNKFIIGVDAKDEEVKVSGWEENTKLNIFDFFKQIEGWGIKQVIFTDIKKDGTLEGPNIDLLKKILSFTNLNIISSGGISSNEDIFNLFDLYLTNSKLTGVIIGKAFYEKKVDLEYIIKKYYKIS
jgi:phosphoribosylformimino-5-aminoimidazole carboxamide ribotide isomerase